MTKSKIITWGLVVWLLTSLLLIGGCALVPGGASPTPGAPSSTGFDWTFLVFIVVIIIIFYFFMIRPQSNRRKQQQKLMAELKPGDQVITTSGIYGEIESLDQDSVVLKIESGGRIRIARQTIAGKRF